MRILVDAMGGDQRACGCGARRDPRGGGAGDGGRARRARGGDPQGPRRPSDPDAAEGRGDRKCGGRGRYARRPGDGSEKEAAVLDGCRLADAARRRRGRIRVRRIYGGAALGGDADGAACEGHPPRGHGADYPDGHGKRHAHRLRRDGGLHAGISAAIRIHGIVLRAEAARRGAAARGAFEHRHGGQQGRASCKRRSIRCCKRRATPGTSTSSATSRRGTCRSAERTWSWRTASPAMCC